MHCAGRLRVLLVSALAFCFLIDSVLFQEKFVNQAKVRIITNLLPGAVAVSRNTHAEHAVFSGTPRARVAGSLCCLWNPERLEVWIFRSDFLE